ncbi:hypothetical protein BDB00DRAFT_608985 [Zychaea mexicana]|uniref:uncharacterized protein n=1 Tax=Zychaea mexicana TaxID=64656 RepID=UPI0022FE68AB|nr:uncharacterized protein BDB00DRAFT_608985 [Zychaea mexicana]KAI9489564.1 hypothetical protein BDB00DRAFT_608985 [Zychaea mexicana]
MQIRILGISENGAKTRVETQIKLCVQLVSSQGTKVPHWSFIRLPEFMLARSKLRKTQQRKLSAKHYAIECDESKVLELTAKVICASDPAKKLRMCAGCVRRERKRAERKKDSHSTDAALSATMSEDAFEKERDRILLFNCEPLVDFNSGDTILPTRITCYCRHHNERVGFRIRFSLHDCNGNVVATGETPSIMITDDHKSTKQPPPPPSNSITPAAAGRKRQRTEYAPATPASSRRGSISTADSSSSYSTPRQSIINLFPHPLTSDQQLSLDQISPLPTPAEERVSSIFGTDTTSTTSSTTTAIATTASSWSIPQHLYASGSSSTMNNTLDLTTAGTDHMLPQTPGALFGHHPSSISAMIPTSTTTTLNQSNLVPSHRSTTSTSSMNVAPTSATPSTPSPVTPCNSQQNHIVSLLSHAPSSTPRIGRLVPAQGPTHGAIEITILGSNFTQGLTCLFGDRPATTLCWSPSTLVCVLPVSPQPGPVVVSFKEHPLVIDGHDVSLFTYYDTNDRALMELALQVVGLQMTGKLQDAKQVAMGIVHGNKQQTNNGSSSPTPASSAPNHQQQQQEASMISMEQRIINALEAVQVDDVSLMNTQGHTLLHLAVLCGYKRLARLLATKNSCDVNGAQDRNGMSPLNMAFWKGDKSMAQVLLGSSSSSDNNVLSSNCISRPSTLAAATTATSALSTSQSCLNLNDLQCTSATTATTARYSHLKQTSKQMNGHLRRYHSFQHDTLSSFSTLLLSNNNDNNVQDNNNNNNNNRINARASDMDKDGLGLAQQKYDQRMYLFWLPLLLVTLGFLCCQLPGRPLLATLSLFVTT